MIKKAIDYCKAMCGNSCPDESLIHTAACIYSTNHFEYSLLYISIYNYFYK